MPSNMSDGQTRIFYLLVLVPLDIADIPSQGVQKYKSLAGSPKGARQNKTLGSHRCISFIHRSKFKENNERREVSRSVLGT